MKDGLLQGSGTPEIQRYLSLITRDASSPLEVIEMIRDARDNEATTGLSIADEHSGASMLDVAYQAAQDIELQRQLQPAQLIGLEALINSEIRPAVEFVGGKFVINHPVWKHLYTNEITRNRIESAAASVGRIELPGNRRFLYGGTGFIVGKDLLMTNRHVAEIFAQGTGIKQLRFRENGRAGIDFVREYNSPPEVLLEVRRVVMIHPYWDMALLNVEGIPDSRPALRLSLQDAREMDGHQIFIIGYPSFDGRNPTVEQDELFSRRYGIKRLQPGELHGGVNAGSFGKTVRAAGHDCSTLGGNSGSAVFDLNTGEVLALHFGGFYHQINYAVPSAALAADKRVVDAGVSFTGPPTIDPRANALWWTRADAENEFQPDDEPAPTGLPSDRDVNGQAQVGQSNLTTQTLNVNLPLTITVSVAIGDVRAVSIREASGADEQEALREPWHDANYSGRNGYDEAFLGDSDAELRVPLPSPESPDELAVAIDGSTVLHYQNFSIAVHAKRRMALFTASNVTREAELRKPLATANYTRTALSDLKKGDHEKWFLDPRLDPQYQLPDAFFRKGRGSFDKGHIVRRQDVAWGTTFAELRRANGDTYHATNCSPQIANFNRSNLGRDNWGALENLVLKSASAERLCIFSGPVLRDSDENFLSYGEDGAIIRAKIPSSYWKVVVARLNGGLAAYGFVLEQDLSNIAWEFTVTEEFTPFMAEIAEIASAARVTFPSEILNADQFFTASGVELEMAGVSRHSFA
ncbi:DNA/RNA non-specific endonuclease [Paraburkholderia caribensis]|uniref:DNA/RNA non-specific endonuclease n=1 Tax=Paraburkholderia caribensis TaxID=75105 RepID=UPI00071FBE31|nr:DNA/RNA non-specific endonuclease [Paraburkholderia caribensis]ALP65202.1 hypothetical protein AN416_21640 [Paraburkholderia caribensis]AUT53645.1 hypothetical protein C2L66_16850 [Paraburkholderia caribensis]